MEMFNRGMAQRACALCDFCFETSASALRLMKYCHKGCCLVTSRIMSKFNIYMTESHSNYPNDNIVSRLTCFLFLWRNKGSTGFTDQQYQRECKCSANQAEMWVGPTVRFIHWSHTHQKLLLFATVWYCIMILSFWSHGAMHAQRWYS